MGYYIQGPMHGKAQMLMDRYGAKNVSIEEAVKIIKEPDSKDAVVCVMDNGPFEAAAYIYNEDEWHAFMYPDDHRPKQWLRMSKEMCEALSGYDQREKANG